MTIQRLRILEFLKSVHTHPTADEVYCAVKEELPMITLATVYRNLNLLAEEGQILRLELNNEYHYDADISMHQHALCECCGQIMDIPGEKTSKGALASFPIKEFAPKNVAIIFFGLCKKCNIGGNKK